MSNVRIERIPALAAEDYDSQEYRDLCLELGFRSDVKFVKVEGGCISFTMGKPDEVRALYCAALEAGYRPSKGLRDACRR